MGSIAVDPTLARKKTTDSSGQQTPVPGAAMLTREMALVASLHAGLEDIDVRAGPEQAPTVAQQRQ